MWVFADEIPEGTWGGGGGVMGLADIVGHVIGDSEAAERYAASRLADRGARVAP